MDSVSRSCGAWHAYGVRKNESTKLQEGQQTSWNAGVERYGSDDGLTHGRVCNVMKRRLVIRWSGGGNNGGDGGGGRRRVVRVVRVIGAEDTDGMWLMAVIESALA